jgi:HlyD family secretion protein
VRIPVDEHYIARVDYDQGGVFTFSNDEYRLRVSKIYPEVVDGRFTVDMNFLGAEPEGIRRGQTLRVRLELGEPGEAVLLANGGFYQTTGGRWIYVLDESGAEARRRRIHIGRQNSEYYEVLEGLEPGERVIVSSYDDFGDAEWLVLK